MTRARARWTDGTLTIGTLLKPHRAARALFHPAWIPDALDPTIEGLKRFRVVAGIMVSLGVYTFVEGGFAVTELMENVLTASLVLLFLTPLTVGVMLHLWRRTGTVRQLRTPLLNCLKLLLLFVGCLMSLVLLSELLGAESFMVSLGAGLMMLWMFVFVGFGAVRVSGNLFGTAAVHRCLPALLATVTSWLTAVPDLVTGDLHGLSLTMGVVFILGGPVTVTAIALLEMRRLGRRYGIRLRTHPAHLPPLPSAQGNPYGGHAHPGTRGGDPYAAGAAGNPYTPGPRNPCAPPPRHPYDD